MDFDATGTPADLVAALSLTRGSRYAVQNASTTATLFRRAAAAPPDAAARAFRVEAGGEFTFRPRGTPYWLWTDDPRGCPVIVDPAA